MNNVFFDVLFESVYAAVTGTIFFYLWVKGKKLHFNQKNGWYCIIAGFGLIFVGTLIDIADDLDLLNRFLIFENANYQPFLKNVAGYALGSILIAIGFWKFLPTIFPLRESEERLRKIIELSPISMAIVAMNGTIEYINHRAIATFGYLPEDIPDMDQWWLKAYPDETYRAKVCSQWMDLFMRAMATNREIERREYRVTCKDGTVKTMMIFGTIVADKVFVMFEDITDRKLAQDEINHLNSKLEALVAERTSELVRSNRDLASFCYAISHELRAPVARLKGLSQAFQEDLAEDPAEAMHCAKRISVASNQLQRVIDSVLQLSRLSQLEFVMQQLDLSAMVREIAAAMIAEAPGRQIEMVIAADISASGDASLVRLCLENLLGNAIKYSVRQPVARIEFGRDAATGAIFVRDNGIGFDMVNAEKLFEPFIRLHREEEFAGSGIGLATVQRIIERHGGRIWAEAAPKMGATFFLTLESGPGGQQ